MNHKILVLTLVLMISGCSWLTTKPDQIVVTKIEYIRTDIPEVLLEIPDAVVPIDLSNAAISSGKTTEKTVALWITDMYYRMDVLEQKLISIGILTKRLAESETSAKTDKDSNK